MIRLYEHGVKLVNGDLVPSDDAASREKTIAYKILRAHSKSDGDRLKITGGSTVGFDGNDALYSLCFPMVELLLLRTPFLPFEVEVFKDNDIGIMCLGIINDELGGLLGDVQVDAFCPRPQRWHPSCPMLLGLLDPVYGMVQRVFITLEFEYFPAKDSAI